MIQAQVVKEQETMLLPMGDDDENNDNDNDTADEDDDGVGFVVNCSDTHHTLDECASAIILRDGFLPKHARRRVAQRRVSMQKVWKMMKCTCVDKHVYTCASAGVHAHTHTHTKHTHSGTYTWYARTGTHARNTSAQIHGPTHQHIHTPTHA